MEAHFILILYLVFGYCFSFVWSKRKAVPILFFGSLAFLEHKVRERLLQRWQLIPAKTQGGYLIPYFIGTQHYHLFVEDDKRKKSHLITKVVIDNDTVWTEDFRKLLGHNGKMSQQKVTPGKLGFENVEVQLATGKKKVYTKDDHIDL